MERTFQFIILRVHIHDAIPVIQISEWLEINEHETVGKLFRVWSWATKYSRDGYIRRIGFNAIDNIVEHRGFGDAMHKAGLAAVDKNRGLFFPRIDEFVLPKILRISAEAVFRNARRRELLGEELTPRVAISKRRRLEIFRLDGFRCVYCGAHGEVKLVIDHIVPVSRGGDDSLENLATSREDCNAGKSDVPLGDSLVAEIKSRIAAQRSKHAE